MAGGLGAPPVNLPYATTVTATVSAGQNYFYLLLNGGNVTTFSFSTPDTQNAEIVTVVFQQDATGSRTVGFATNVYATPTINSTANKYTVVQFLYDTQSQGWCAITSTHN